MAIRAMLSSMSPKRAIGYIKSFELPEDEETVLIELDVRGKSCVQISQQLHVSPETVKRYRQKAYKKISDDIDR